jgi:hypothetical protein
MVPFSTGHGSLPLLPAKLFERAISSALDDMLLVRMGTGFAAGSFFAVVFAVPDLVPDSDFRLAEAIAFAFLAFSSLALRISSALTFHLPVAVCLRLLHFLSAFAVSSFPALLISGSYCPFSTFSWAS